MQITPITQQGLAREYRIDIPADDLESQFLQKIIEFGKTAHLKGFRPGKVPLPVLKRIYGKQIFGQYIQTRIQDSSRQLIEQEALRPASRPDIKIAEDFEQGKDLQFHMSLEVMPEIPPIDFSGLTIERPVLDKAEEEEAAEKALQDLAEANCAYEERKKNETAQKGDLVRVDFTGYIDGKEFAGSSAEDFDVKIGAEQFIPGFENGLLGAKTGQELSISCQFPAQYNQPKLAGKEAIFATMVKVIKAACPPQIDASLATRLGAKSLEDLRNMVRERVKSEFGEECRSRLKRNLLDQLDGYYDFDLPPNMVAMEAEQIQRQIAAYEAQKKQSGMGEDSIEQAPDEQETQKLAQRRVRLGLAMAEMGLKNGIVVPQNEIEQNLAAQAARYGAKAKEFIAHAKKTPAMMENIRAPLFEGRVCDFILEQVVVQDKIVTREELFADPDAPPAPAPAQKKKSGQGKTAKAKSSSSAKSTPARSATKDPASKPANKKTADAETSGAETSGAKSSSSRKSSPKAQAATKKEPS